MARERAKRLLRHYLTMALESSGRRIDGDVHTEIGDIVDYIVDAAVEAVKAELTAAE